MKNKIGINGLEISINITCPHCNYHGQYDKSHEKNDIILCKKCGKSINLQDLINNNGKRII